MKRQIIAAVAAGALMLSVAGAASADFGPNENSKPQSDNCIAIFSSGVTGNGTAPGGTLGEGNNAAGQTGPSGGARGAEIKALQAACNNANGK